MTQTATRPSRRPGVVHLSLFGSVRIKAQRRSMAVVGLVIAASLSIIVIQLISGDLAVPFSRVIATLGGHGTPIEEFAIYDLRLPRALTAAFAGAAFGASGAVYQSVTRNPLGSPDIIGFTYGAAFGAVFAISVLRASGLTVTVAALAGGLGVALLVYGLAFRGGIAGYRLILVGIGISAVLASFISYLLLRASIIDAQEAYVWLTGSLNGRGWDEVRISLAGLALLGPVLIGLGPGLRMSELGDDLARATGVAVGRNRTYALLFGALLCATAVVCVGPISFIALAAPQIARRLANSPTVQVIPSMAVGALLLLASDLAAQQAFPRTQLPVGIATLVLGGGYLAWLIAFEKKGRIG